MEKSFEIRFPFEGDYENLKILWQTAFDDTKESLDSFFSNSVSPERILVAFDGVNPVSALYMLESEIIINRKAYSAYYIYAVCTHPAYRGKGLMKKLFCELFGVAKSRGIDYIFLVPEEEYLFCVYEKLGFKQGFSYTEKKIHKKDFDINHEFKTEKLTYEEYRKSISENLPLVPVAVLKESTFKSFFRPVNSRVKILFVENQGYVLYEETDEKTTVFELFGNEEKLLNAVFKTTQINSLAYRETTNGAPIPYGMYYKLNDVPEIQNGFFGIPYSD